MNRLFEFTYLLLKKKCITAKELSEYFGVSVRTVYRDVEMLSAAGIPVYAKQGKNGGIAILDNFVLDKSILSEEEQRQILAALESVQAVEKYNNNSTVSKLSGIFQVESPNWVNIDFSDWSNQRQELFATVKNAIIEKHVLKFQYYNRLSQTSTRLVEPIQLWFKDYTWFLKAYCREKQAMRVFKLTRMKRVEYLDETFEPKPVDLTAEEKFTKATPDSQKMLSFSMKIDECMAYQVYDFFEEHEITQNKDGSFTLSLCYPDSEWVYGMILSYGNHATIISPQSLKDEIANRLRKTLENYS